MARDIYHFLEALIHQLLPHYQIIIDCAIHAREWVSPAFCFWMINELSDGSLTSWTDYINFIIYPVLNPDGYHYSYTSDRYWRKNRNDNNGHRCKGVDLNRNYDAEWGYAGTDTDKCGQTYGGTKAFSEPESQAHRDHQTALPNKLAYLTYHAYSQFIIYPYSSSYQAEAHNKPELDAVAKKMAQ